MKKYFIISLIFMIFSGCSSSPAIKSNNVDSVTVAFKDVKKMHILDEYEQRAEDGLRFFLDFRDTIYLDIDISERDQQNILNKINKSRRDSIIWEVILNYFPWRRHAPAYKIIINCKTGEKIEINVRSGGLLQINKSWYDYKESEEIIVFLKKTVDDFMATGKYNDVLNEYKTMLANELPKYNSR